ncbi:uncharacterized protein LOC132314085 [Cornus florida]|uniref:uncharacterized protein LOC132314085 n=1 Tax=Cornus florida TaxID=4283 RepID=UPI0028A00F52|nr:uncharacterized protein LOC132314085 [Cornus florida]
MWLAGPPGERLSTAEQRLRQGWKFTEEADTIHHSLVRVSTATTTSAILANYNSSEFSTGQKGFFYCTNSVVWLSVVKGMFLVSHSWARVLFDSSVSFSFIVSSFAWALGLEVSQLDRPFCVDTPIGGSVTLGRVCRGCSITIVGRVLEFDLILLEMTGFDVILGMDSLSSFRAIIDCFRGKVSVCTLDGDCFCFVGDRCDSFTPSFYGIRGQDRQTFFLASLLADDDVEFCWVDYPKVVRDFLDVFPKDLTEFPPHQEVDFAINLMPGIMPISMAPYRMAPIELE